MYSRTCLGRPPFSAKLSGRECGDGRRRQVILLCTKIVLGKVWWTGKRGLSSKTVVAEERFHCTKIISTSPGHNIKAVLVIHPWTGQ